jgi:hypothetical protein
MWGKYSGIENNRKGKSIRNRRGKKYGRILVKNKNGMNANGVK